MPEQEKIVGPEITNNPEDFAEKLKKAEQASVSPEERKGQMEEVIKRNKERVQQSENAIERAQEKVASTPAPSKTKTKKQEEEVEEKQKEHVKFHAKDISSIQNPDDQIMKIVDLASKKDPYFAIKVAKHIDNNYILDKVHDQLTEDQVRDVLIKKGLLEEIQ